MWSGRIVIHEEDDLKRWVCEQVKAGKPNPKDASTVMTSESGPGLYGRQSEVREVQRLVRMR